jgi:hypothetical protein
MSTASLMGLAGYRIGDTAEPYSYVSVQAAFRLCNTPTVPVTACELH